MSGSDTKQRMYTAGDLKAAADMSYRQLNDWETKGVVSADKDRGEGWRKFSARDFFAILVCAEFRKRFGIPLEQIKFVKDFMCKDGVDHLRAAFKLMNLGLSVYLLTDFKETFVLDSDLEFEDLMFYGYFRDDRPQGYVFLRVNDIVNRVLGCLKEPMEIKPDNNFYHEMARERAEVTACSPAEGKILQLIRKKNVHQVTVSLRKGSITKIDVEEDITEKINAKADAVTVTKEADFETVTFSTQHGKVVMARRKKPMPVSVEENKRILFGGKIFESEAN